MRSRLVLSIGLVAMLAATVARGDDVARANVSVTARFAPRTSLKVSSELLQFDLAQPGGVATATIELTAGARTPSGDDVVLTVEPVRALEGPGGAADADATLSVTGEGDGLVASEVHPTRTTIVGRWQGSGLRTGRLVFWLRANAAGSYAMRVRFVLSTP